MSHLSLHSDEATRTRGFLTVLDCTLELVCTNNKRSGAFGLGTELASLQRLVT